MDQKIDSLLHTHRVLCCLLRSGFYGVYRIGHIRLDHHLITTLVERWRIETRTFHFPVGEATVTLQDVALLFGLPVDKDAVSGKDPGNKLDDLIVCLSVHYVAYWGVLVPDKSQNIVKMMFLPLLRDFDRIHEFSWGAATLACLYRMLCWATKPNTKEMARPLVLLQFIWEPFGTENEIMAGFPSYCTIGGDIWMA
ncbi:hypothetical protein ACSBR2_010851 [Camellia fascicularis]